MTHPRPLVGAPLTNLGHQGFVSPQRQEVASLQGTSRVQELDLYDPGLRRALPVSAPHELRHTSGHARCIFADLVFPHSKNPPTGGLKGGGTAAVTLDVLSELPSPERSRTARRNVVIWTSVPEATVEEDGDPGSREHKVRARPADRSM